MNLSISNWEDDARNTRRGYLSVTFHDIDMIVSDIVAHCVTRDDGSERWWFALPAREYTRRDGSKGFWHYVRFKDPGKAAAVQSAILFSLRNTVPNLVGRYADTKLPDEDQARLPRPQA